MQAWSHEECAACLGNQKGNNVAGQSEPRDTGR